MFYGEAGNDRITGNGSGGPGNDVLMAQRGWFFDDDGPTRGHDVYRSWDGERRRQLRDAAATGVLVDLRPGQRSEDRLEGIPRVIGGEGKDVLIGDDARNVFEGGPGLIGSSAVPATTCWSPAPGTTTAASGSTRGPAATTSSGARSTCGADPGSRTPWWLP